MSAQAHRARMRGPARSPRLALSYCAKGERRHEGRFVTPARSGRDGEHAGVDVLLLLLLLLLDGLGGEVRRCDGRGEGGCAGGDCAVLASVSGSTRGSASRAAERGRRTPEPAVHRALLL